MHPEELLKFSVSWALAAGGHTFDKAKFVKAMYVLDYLSNPLGHGSHKLLLVLIESTSNSL